MDYSNTNLNPRPCGCKGCRVCLICENEYGAVKKDFFKLFKTYENQYVYCTECERFYRGWLVEKVKADHPKHNGAIGIFVPGIYVQLDFLTIDEETKTMTGIDKLPWDSSQSGRRKQQYGPKTNFKKMKLATGNLKGYPKFSEFIQKKFAEVPLLSDFKTIEQCSLEYDPDKGSSIDPHIDDCWIWGERIVTVNLLSDSVLTLTKFKGDINRYNLSLVDTYKSKLILKLAEKSQFDNWDNVVLRIPMPRRSLMVLYDAARFHWEHCVLREDILTRRVCIAYREFTKQYLPGGVHYDKGKPILELSQLFWDNTNE